MNIKRFMIVLVITVLLWSAVGSAPLAALDRAVRLQVLKAVVQLGPVAEFEVKGGTELRAMGWGSGTIISPDGLILTNYHVIDVSDAEAPENARILAGRMGVFITTKSDRPPTLSYIATVVVEAPALDLAVLRITHNMSGEEIDPDKLKLPYVELGDSDDLEAGDTVYIFGYPGIGGETITFTSGNVSGFTAEEDAGERAWIKTDATIAGGNSGGTAVDDDGKLIGVPTRGGSGGGAPVTDCRRITDTNGDGQIDAADMCVPMGGFINALRPVALAIPLIREAQEGSEPAADEPGQTDEPVTEGVQVTGVILDANTGKPVPGALFLALLPGVAYDDWETDDQIYSSAKADKKGLFTLPDLLARGETYTLVAGLKGYMPVYEDHIWVDEEAEAVIELEIKLQKSD